MLKGKATTTTQQKGKATQHNSPETVIFQRKIGCLGWDSNPRPSAIQAMLLPTERGLGEDRLMEGGKGRKGKNREKKKEKRKKMGKSREKKEKRRERRKKEGILLQGMT